MISKNISRVMTVGRKVVAVEPITEDRRGFCIPLIPAGAVGEVEQVISETAHVVVCFRAIAGAENVMASACVFRPATAKDFQ